jgi:hypothetical protein
MHADRTHSLWLGHARDYESNGWVEASLATRAARRSAAEARVEHAAVLDYQNKLEALERLAETVEKAPADIPSSEVARLMREIIGENSSGS